MAKTLYVNCPFCEGLMEIDSQTGKVIQKWEAGKGPQNSGDKLSSALKKLSEDKKKRVNLFDQKQEELKENKEKMEDLFKNEVKKVKKEGVKENPFRPFDLD